MSKNETSQRGGADVSEGVRHCATSKNEMLQRGIGEGDWRGGSQRGLQGVVVAAQQQKLRRHRGRALQHDVKKFDVAEGGRCKVGRYEVGR